MHLALQRQVILRVQSREENGGMGCLCTAYLQTIRHLGFFIKLRAKVIQSLVVSAKSAPASS